MDRTSAAPVLAGVLLLLLLCDIITRKRLWGHLVPAFFMTSLRNSGRRLGRAYKTISTPRKKEAVPDEPEPDHVPTAPEQEESVFKQAKRRSRFDERDE